MSTETLELCRVYDDLVQAHVAISDGSVEYAFVSLRDASRLAGARLACASRDLDQALEALGCGRNGDALQRVDAARRKVSTVIFNRK